LRARLHTLRRARHKTARRVRPGPTGHRVSAARRPAPNAATVAAQTGPTGPRAYGRRKPATAKLPHAPARAPGLTHGMTHDATPARARARQRLGTTGPHLRRAQTDLTDLNGRTDKIAPHTRRAPTWPAPRSTALKRPPRH
jgi:hypothetical protein